MPLVDALLPEFDHEMITTRKLLERVPEERLEWRPHARAWPLGTLAQHVATLPLWGRMTLTLSELDLAGFEQASAVKTRAELLALFDQHVSSARTALVGKTDAELMAPWALKREGHVIFTMPKAGVWRSFVMSHLIHHRGQLSVYLRIQDVPVPSIYGPSADEGTL
jgi:uncharacterized damage-inducible protein DinB